MFFQIRQLTVLNLLVAEHFVIFSIFVSFYETKRGYLFFVPTAIKHWVDKSLELDCELAEEIVDPRGGLCDQLTLVQRQSIVLFHAAEALVDFVERPYVQIFGPTFKSPTLAKQIHADTADDKLSLVLLLEN